jgi:MFS family permease
MHLFAALCKLALFIMMTSGMVILLFTPGGLAILAGAALFGAGSGASSPARAALVAEFYGVANYGCINGTMSLAMTLAKASAPVEMGFLYTWTGQYAPVFWTLAVASAGQLDRFYWRDLRKRYAWRKAHTPKDDPQG